ncbi:MAG: hypothetical protein ACRENG_24100 [bacterium]
MKIFFFVLVSVILFVTGLSPVAAQIPRTLSYQGVLTDNAGKPRPDGSYTFTFRFYTSPTGGTAIWSESKSLPVKSGLFSTVLGEQTPFGAAVKFDQQYWLGIQVGSEPELSPRIALTSVGYSFSSLRADTAGVSVASLADTMWKHSGDNIYRLNGNVGIGTTSPGQKLDVVGNLNLGDAGTNSDYGLYMIRGGGGGNQGQGRIVVRHSTQAAYSGSVAIEPYWYNGSAYEYRPNAFVVDATGNVGIGTETPTEKLEVAGRTKTCVLEITGGCDLAEPFEISESQPIPKGALVIIDEENPGQLKLSHQAYDKRVAGVVSLRP